MSAIGGINAYRSQSVELWMTGASNTTTGRAAEVAGSTSSGGASRANEEGIEALQSAIEEAVNAALARLDPSSDAKTVMEAVRNAVDSTLKANGIEPPSGPGAALRDGSGPPSGGPPPSEFGGPNGNNPLRSMIDRLLEANGFDPDAIHEELMNARAAESGESASANASGVTSTDGDSSSNSAWLLLAEIGSGSGINTEV